MAEQTGSGASLADFIWKNAEDLWGDFKHTDFGKIILPFTLLRRLVALAFAATTGQQAALQVNVQHAGRVFGTLNVARHPK